MSEPVGNDPFNLTRFVAAQEPVIEQVFAELRGARKEVKKARTDHEQGRKKQRVGV